ncbi:hypothetical protein B4144_0574 [Bacillus atrophaeus]|nr:hypothetical protein B4144_0574 [Bacillus atrophaeus]
MGNVLNRLIRKHNVSREWDLPTALFYSAKNSNDTASTFLSGCKMNYLDKDL